MNIFKQSAIYSIMQKGSKWSVIAPLNAWITGQFFKVIYLLMLYFLLHLKYIYTWKPNESE